MLMFTAAYRACKGKYIAFVSNDTEVTEGWLERLVCCLEQTPGAVSATPVTPYTSNFQGVVSLSEEERARFVLPSVQQGNWRQRSRIMPVIGVYDKEKVNAIGFADRIFWSMEFWDDDFSFRARRKGYRQMLCTEVYCHHLGSLTGGEAWAREKTLERGREIFRKKHQMDPWAKGFCRQADFMTLLEMWKPAWQKMDCLAIDCGYGDAAMEAGNHCRMFGTQTFWQAITTERMFLPDAIGFAEKWEYARNLEETLYRCFEKNRFHFILREEVSHEGLLRLLGQGLVAGGILMTLSDLDVLPDFERIGQRGKWRMWQKKMG